jgi:uncharacterized protein YvpB
MIMDNTLLFLLAFFTIVLSLLVLFIKETKRLRNIVLTGAILCFLMFGYGLATSNSLKSALFGKGIQTAKSQFKEKEFESIALAEGPSIEPQEMVLEYNIKESVLLEIPVVSQLPELPRGCEVTSLAMLLQYAGVNVGKMELAERITKDPTPYQLKDGKVFFGHPNVGFVGDMYSKSNPGYGVYHKPIKELANRYLPDSIVDLTGREFREIEESLSNGFPVWVITNSRFKELPPEQFRTWNTPEGVVQITFREHSVLITGYDRDYVYVNDPLTGEKNKKVLKQNFVKSWKQLGSQTITYVNS